MKPRLSFARVLTLAGLLVAGASPLAHAVGARLFKSGPIQTDLAGMVWVANRDHDSVTRIDMTRFDPTSGLGWVADEFPLPDPGTRHSPRGLSVQEDGLRVYVACHDSDRIYVLNASDGSLVQRIDLPWGSGPYSVALSRAPAVVPPPPQTWALVTLHRSSAIAVIETAGLRVSRVLTPTYQAPLAIEWMEDGLNAWVTHLFADGEHPRLSRVNFANPADPKYVTRRRLLPTHPQRAWNFTDTNGDEFGIAPDELPEGGYILTRGHVAQIPNGVDGSRLWMTVQYQNIHADHVSPDTVVQATIRKVVPALRHVPDTNNNNDKVVLTANAVHQIVTGGAYQGAGWNAAVAGPVDIAFSANGATAWILFENSENLLEVPTGTSNVKPAVAPPLRTVDVGSRPMGFTTSPVSDLGFVANIVDRTVSVIDLPTMRELTRIPVSAGPDPLTPSLLNGERFFHTSNDPRVSVNRKVSCASCHLNAEHDGRNWDLQHVTNAGGGRQPPGGGAGGTAPTPTGPGTRNTQTLSGLGLAFGAGGQDANGFGQIHHSGDRDEVQDFEHTFRGAQMGGTGFVPTGLLPAPLGTPMAGLDPTGDLDDLAAYVLGLRPLSRSPARQQDGSLTEAAIRGATFFSGSDPLRPADAACATCHDPTTSFTDRAFHDVGSRRGGAENELNNRTNPALNWFVGTPSLIGAWATTPYEGVSTYAETLLDVAIDSQRITGRPGGRTHGDTSRFTNRQLRDLAELLDSVDGNTTPAEVLGARDVVAPRVVRAEPVSLTRIAVWFDESVDPVTAGNPANWRVSEVGGAAVSVTAATFDPQNGDRVDLTVDRLRNGCDPVNYEVATAGPIRDIADTATGGVANVADPANLVLFSVGDTLTLTLGASGYETITTVVHDTATLNNRTWSHGSIWLDSTNGSGGATSTGFLRVDWTAPFLAATGVTNPADLVAASYELTPQFGDSQVIDAHRMLVAWNDMHSGDWTVGPAGNPTWNNRVSGGAAWNAANASASTAGIDGTSPAHYNATNDIATPPDFSGAMPAMNLPFVIGGPQVTDAFRFWLANPSLDYGYGLKLQPNQWNESKFNNSEADLRQHSPLVRIEYLLPAAVNPAPGEVSARGVAEPLRVAKDPTGLRLSFEHLGQVARRYNIYEGLIGTWYSHVGIACLADPVVTGARRALTVAQPVSDAYFLVTAAGIDVEGPIGFDSFGRDRAATHPSTCGPAGCP